MAPPLALQIVSFDWPWPPTYGGVIDVFYRVDSLLSSGVAVDLHVVAGPEPEAGLPDRWDTPLLRVFAYGRRGWASAIGRRPYVVASRAVAMEMTVLGFDPFFKGDTALDGSVRVVKDFDEFLKQLDVITFHVPGGAGTKHLLDKRRLFEVAKGVRRSGATP